MAETAMDWLSSLDFWRKYKLLLLFIHVEDVWVQAHILLLEKKVESKNYNLLNKSGQLINKLYYENN